MNFGLRISATVLVTGLIIIFVALAISVGTAYAAAEKNCLSFPQQYPFMSTRFHNGSCQFQENNGWVTFNPTS